MMPTCAPSCFPVCNTPNVFAPLAYRIARPASQLAASMPVPPTACSSASGSLPPARGLVHQVATWPLIHQAGSREVHLFMFVNRSSGGRRGERLMQIPQPFEVLLPDGRRATLKVFDIREGAPGEKPGFLEMKKAAASSVVRMIVAGGDGTILWAIEEAEKHRIDTRHQVLLAVMPLGTGNDFSRFTGWGGQAPKMNRLLYGECEGLRQLVREWATVRPRAHDIWRVVLQVDEQRGSILQTGKDRKKEPLREKKITKLMHSYFSAGNDARAGMSQEKARTSTRWGNMMNYGFQICLKGLPFREKEYVKEFAESLHHGTDPTGRAIFCTAQEQWQQGVGAEAPAPQLVGNPQVFLVLNIPNCYGGFCRFWDGAGSLGVDPGDHGLLRSELDASDGKLEVLTYSSLLMEPLVTAATQKLPAHRFNAKRVFSGAPIFLQFAEDEESEVVVHCQIDGEFFKLVNPASVTFELHRKIRVLHSGRGMDQGDDETDDSDEPSEPPGEAAESEEDGVPGGR